MDYYSKDACYDKYPPPCFFEEDDEENFYHSTPGDISPSEDIWKKFELLPTPPRSPRREPLDTIPESLESSIADIFEGFPLNQTVLFPELDGVNPSLKSKLIQDCMWSGNNLNEDIKKCEKSSESGASNSASSLDINVSTECVDPAAVFPYPISESRQVQKHSLGTETPSDSASSDEEEIDVVTVDKKVVVRRKHQSNTGPTTTTIVVHKPKSSSGHHSVVLNNHHDYSISASSATSINILKRPRTVCTSNSPNSHPSKRMKHQLSISELEKGVAQRLKSSSHSRPSSDSEDSDGKRTQHNVLERKRRNDLKYSFMTLRDNVPELNSQERAPKVLILKKAAEFIHKLNKDHSKLKSDIESQKQRRESLQRRLSLLRRN